jgi:hypothetical protein
MNSAASEIKATPKLGENQAHCLRALRRSGRWPGGWKWGNASATKRILDGLVRKGLATETGGTYRPVQRACACGQVLADETETNAKCSLCRAAAK